MTRAERVPLLLIDDDPLVARLMRVLFDQARFDLDHAETGQAGVEHAERTPPAVVILDLRLPDMSGMDVLKKLRALCPQAPVIMLTGSADLKNAVEAMQLGAFHYLSKPVDNAELLLLVKRALEHSELLTELTELRRKSSPLSTLTEQMGTSPAVATVAGHVGQVADSNFTVLVLGETGTGKELVAQALHAASSRRDKSLIALDCGAIPEQLLESELFGHEKGAFTGADRKREGLFQLAQGGTLFLDEIGNLPLTLQAKLLRVMESREVKPVGGSKPVIVDVRFLAATHGDLLARVREGTFREDLYFRLAQYTIPLPPLRERLEDVPHLAGRFLKEAALELHRPVVGFTGEALGALRDHRWPGNVRELRNLVRLAVLQCQEREVPASVVRRLTTQGGPADAAAPVSVTTGVTAGVATGRTLREIADAAVREAETRAITQALAATAGNKSAAAKALQTDYKTLHLKIQRYGIKARATDDGS
ncbi:MAG TPA: sigma-54 dependent transcriptional regulator [Verrucomicrobiae bacterium]|nr:sigma-54 dependent transcriptional regulator [Verrucomicrobiae bacterium]